MLWTVDTLYTTLSRNDWSNGKNSRTKVLVLAVVCTPVPPPPLLELLGLFLLGLLEPWKQPLHRLESSFFLHIPPPALYPLTNLMHSNSVQAQTGGSGPSLETLMALSEVFWQSLLILHASSTPRPVDMLLLLLLGLWRLSQELQALHPGLDLVLK